MSDVDILEEISKATGLPEDLMLTELKNQIQKYGFNRENITLEEIRELLSNYLQDVFLENISEEKFQGEKSGNSMDLIEFPHKNKKNSENSL